jgi:trimeric autotransporter adhesin
MLGMVTVSVTSSSSQPTVFSAPSFSGSSATLSGGEGGAETTATGTVSVSGSDQSTQSAATAATATIVLSVSSSGSDVKPLYVANSTITIDGFKTSFATPVGTAIGAADALVSALNVSGSPVTASVVSRGTTGSASVNVATIATGTSQNGPITLTLVNGVTSPGASLTGGSNGGMVYDSGTVTADVNGTNVSVSYGQGSTAQAVAQALASAITGGGLAATASGGQNGTLNLTATQAGTAGNGITVSITASSSQPTLFSSPSFSGTSTTLAGGQNGSSTPGTIYSYAIPSPSSTTGYAPNGNLLSFSDSVIGGWNFVSNGSSCYDTVNRLICGNHQWALDEPGNDVELRCLWKS